MTKARKRTARKLVLPLLAIGLMTAMMGLDASRKSPYRPPSPVTMAR